jgi:hypothetical protein
LGLILQLNPSIRIDSPSIVIQVYVVPMRADGRSMIKVGV